MKLNRQLPEQPKKEVEKLPFEDVTDESVE